VSMVNPRAMMIEEREALERWPQTWLDALRKCFPSEWQGLAADAGSGVAALLENEMAFGQAHHTVANGLLSGMNLSASALRATAAQLQRFVLEPLTDHAQ